MQLAEFRIDYILLTNKCERDYITGKFTCVEVMCQKLEKTFIFPKNFALQSAFFVLKRTMGYYILHAFLPSVLCVLASIGSFWIKLQVENKTRIFETFEFQIAPARVTLSIATFLTLTQQQAAVNQGLPRVSYIKVLSGLEKPKFDVIFRQLIFG